MLFAVIENKLGKGENGTLHYRELGKIFPDSLRVRARHLRIGPILVSVSEVDNGPEFMGNSEFFEAATGGKRLDRSRDLGETPGLVLTGWTTVEVTSALNPTTSNRQ
jgi:hypothetical protein